MSDEFTLSFPQSVRADSGNWYQCLQTLGTGKNATVFLVLATSGEHAGLLFALKTFRRLSDETSTRKFADETRFLKECQHPAMMRLIDDGVFRGKYPFMVVEYLPITLRDAMRRGLPMSEKVVFVLQLLSALSHLSQRSPRVIHGDLKPENIFIKGRSCVLGDFGLLRIADEQLWPQSREAPPMPRDYRSPDLVQFGLGAVPLTEKSDLFQLGLVTAEMFSGTNPLRSIGHSEDKLSPIQLDRILPIPGSQGGLIASLIYKTLKFNPDERPPISDLINNWRGVLSNVLRLANEYEGSLFPR